MSRFNTGNPLGSGDPRDLDDNAKNMDLAVNSDELSWRDRFGRDRKSFEGMEREFDSAQHSREARFNDFIASSGYQFVGDYGPGIEITEYNQLIRDSNGEFWRVSGQVDLPYVTTGAGIPEDDALVPAGDAVLRQDLANPDMGAAMVGYGESNVHDALDQRLSFIKPGDNDAETFDTALSQGNHLSLQGEYSGSRDGVLRGVLEVIDKSGVSIVGYGEGHIDALLGNRSAVKFESETVKSSDATITGVVLSNDPSANHDHCAVLTRGVKNANLSLLRIPHSAVGISLGPVRSNPDTLPFTDLKSQNSIVLGNIVQASGFGYEIYSAENSVLSSNVAYKEGERGQHHGYRFVAYGTPYPPLYGGTPTNPVDLKGYGFVSGLNVASNFSNGVSLQKGNFNSAHVGYALTNCQRGIVFEGTNVDPVEIPERNIFSAVSIDDVETGIDARGLRKTILSDFIISNFSARAVDHRTGTNGDSSYCRFDGLISDNTASIASPVVFQGRGNRIDVTLADLTDLGSTVVIQGDSNVVTVVAGSSSGDSFRPVSIQGSNNIVKICTTDITSGVAQVSVDGNNNIVEVNLLKTGGGVGTMEVSGTGNQISGVCLFVGQVPAGNDISRVKGCSNRGVYTGTTDNNAEITIPHNLVYTSSYVAMGMIQPGSETRCHVKTKTSTGVTYVVRDLDGTGVRETPVTIGWMAESAP